VSTAETQDPLDAAADTLHVGEVTLDRAAYVAIVRGRRVVLTPQELRVLDALMRNADHVLSRTYLFDTLWGPDRPDQPNTLHVHILRLRNKLERQLNAGRHIRTVRRAGYIYDTEPL
jgi:two-component system OmpR family response regulator